jgi:hypothetical protein
MRNTLFAAILAVLSLGPSADGGMIVRRTRLDGANAIRFGRRTLNLDGFIDFRQTNPGWFAEHNPKLGRALTRGKETLIARRELNPGRFDRYHPCLGYLLADPFTDEPEPGTVPDPTPIPPTLSPEVLKPPPGDVPDGGDDPPPPPGVETVPEPATWGMIASALGGLGLVHAARRATTLRRRAAGG